MLDKRYCNPSCQNKATKRTRKTVTNPKKRFALRISHVLHSFYSRHWLVALMLHLQSSIISQQSSNRSMVFFLISLLNIVMTVVVFLELYSTIVQKRHFSFFFRCTRFQAGHVEISPGYLEIETLYNILLLFFP